MGLPKGTSSQIFTWDETIKSWVLSPPPTTEKVFLWASQQGAVLGAVGQMQIFGVTTGNPGGIIPQTKSSSPGINNSGVNPFTMPACTLVRAVLSYAQATVSQGTTGGAMIANFPLYNAAFSTRALVKNLAFPVTNADVNDTITSNQFSRGIVLSGLSDSIEEGALLGLEFENRDSDNNDINGMGRMYVYMEFDL